MIPLPILLVEDNESDVGLTKRALKKTGIDNPLVVAEDGQEALDYLHGDNTHPVLILLDLKLPRVDGLTVLRRIRNDERTRRLPVVVLTSSLEEQDLASAYDSGANSYLRKPVDYEQFSRTISQTMQYWLTLNERPPVP